MNDGLVGGLDSGLVDALYDAQAWLVGGPTHIQQEEQVVEAPKKNKETRK